MAPITLFFFIITLSTSLSLTSSSYHLTPSSIPTTAATTTTTSPSITATITTTPPSTTATITTTQPLTTETSPLTTLTTSQFLTAITQTLSNLNFHNLATATYTLSHSSDTHLPWLLSRPITIFAPFDSSLHTCHLCSIPLLLQERTVPGLYPFNYLTHLHHGTKIQSILPGRCITVASGVDSSRIFINGAEITHPDLFVSDYVIIHGIQGVISHLSDYSCVDNKMTSVTHPHSSSTTATMTKMMLTDVMIRLKTSGYDILSLAIKVKLAELVKLNSMTIFAVNDSVIFNEGHSYIHNVRYHVIPNKLLKVADLERFPVSTKLATLENGDFLTVTTPGGGGAGKKPMRINYVKIQNPDLIWNSRIVIHGLASPFPHIRQPMRLTSGRSGFDQSSPSGGFGSDARESTVGPVQHTEINSPSRVVVNEISGGSGSDARESTVGPVQHTEINSPPTVVVNEINPSGGFGSDARESAVGPVQYTETNSPAPVVVDTGVHQGL